MKLTFLAVEGIPLIEPGDDLIAIINQSLQASGESFQQDDVLVLAQKIVSKAENRYVDLADVIPGPEAIALAQEVDKDPRQVEVILSESSAVVRKRPGVLIVEHKLGFVHANAGVDQSNIEHAEGRERVLLLPKDPDRSAAQLQERIKSLCGVDVAVIILANWVIGVGNWGLWLHRPGGFHWRP
jgi:coenzyme F420-0:L-glutamate ligase/coenzyme F420-1:gamma-L-glutamate ligase